MRGRSPPGEKAVRQSPQLGRRQSAPEGSGRHGEPQAVVLELPARRSRRWAAAVEPSGRARVRGCARLPGQRSGSTVHHHRGGDRALRLLAGASARSGLRDRRGRRQARRRGSARALGGHLTGSSLGDRLQVPARGTHDEAARHHGLGRPHRPRDAVRRPRPGLRRRFDRVDGDTAQPGPGGDQGRPTRRHGGGAQSRRRDPRGGRPGAVAAAGRQHAVGVPDGVSALREPARSPRG